MTVPQAPLPKKRVKVEPEPGGQLEQFLIAHKKAHDEADAASEQEEEYKKAVKSWLLSLFENPEDLPDAFDIAADAHGRYPGYTLTLKGVGAFRLSTERLKAAEPEKYVQYAVPVTPTWELRESTQGRRRRS